MKRLTLIIAAAAALALAAGCAGLDRDPIPPRNIPPMESPSPR
jgi:hypothetical protein